MVFHQVLRFLATENLFQPHINLTQIAWRLRNKAFFIKVPCAGPLLRSFYSYPLALLTSRSCGVVLTCAALSLSPPSLSSLFQVTDVLRTRHIFDKTLWSFSLMHEVELRTHLPHNFTFDTHCCIKGSHTFPRPGL